MRLTLVLLLALTVTPISAFAYGNKTVIEVYQEAIQKLTFEYEKLKQLTAEAKQKVADLENDANSIKTLIAKYETALKTSTEDLEKKHEAQLKALEKKHEAELKAVKDAYQTELAAEAKLAELARHSAEEARHSAEDNDKATRALLDKLGSAEKLAKLTNAVSVSSEGKVGIGTDTPSTKLEIAGGLTVGNDGDNSQINFKAANGKTAFIGTQDDNNQGFYVHTGGQYRLSVNQNGNVGIGTTTPGAKLDVAGNLIRTIAYATGNGPNDQRDAGPVNGRVLSFNKAKTSTKMRISYTDNLRTFGTRKACRWEIRVDGSACPNQALVYDDYARKDDDTHTSRTVVGYCSGLAAGSHTIGIWVSNTPGYSVGDCWTGFRNATWVIEAEEVN
jgi:hypothetical protein